MADQQPGAVTLESRGVTRDDMATAMANTMSAPVAPTATAVAMTTSAPMPAQTAAAVPAGTATAVPAADAPEQLVVVRASLVRSISQARPVVASTGAAGKKGVPVLTCRCAHEAAEKVCVGVMLVVGYLFIACVIIFGAGCIARLTAATDMYGGSLGFVSWLLCMILFVLCGGCWAKIAQHYNHDDESNPALCCGGWMFFGVIASILCVVLSHVGDKIDYMEAAKPAELGIGTPGSFRSSFLQKKQKKNEHGRLSDAKSILRSDPRSTGPGYPLEDPDVRWVQDEVREFELH